MCMAQCSLQSCFLSCTLIEFNASCMSFDSLTCLCRSLSDDKKYKKYKARSLRLLCNCYFILHIDATCQCTRCVPCKQMLRLRCSTHTHVVLLCCIRLRAPGHNTAYAYLANVKDLCFKLRAACTAASVPHLPRALQRAYFYDAHCSVGCRSLQHMLQHKHSALQLGYQIRLSAFSTRVVFLSNKLLCITHTPRASGSLRMMSAEEVLQEVLQAIPLLQKGQEVLQKGRL